MWAVGATRRLSSSSSPNLGSPLSQRLSRKCKSRRTRTGPDGADATLSPRVSSMAFGGRSTVLVGYNASYVFTLPVTFAFLQSKRARHAPYVRHYQGRVDHIIEFPE